MLSRLIERAQRHGWVVTAQGSGVVMMQFPRDGWYSRATGHDVHHRAIYCHTGEWGCQVGWAKCV